MFHHVILRIIAKVLIPVIMLSALYVQFHGDYGPGGGFQAGVIFAVAIILCSFGFGFGFGFDDALAVAPPPVPKVTSCAGVLIYASVGVETVILVGNYLD